MPQPVGSAYRVCNSRLFRMDLWRLLHNTENSLLISLLAGNLTVETGSTATASATIFVHFRIVHP